MGRSQAKRKSKTDMEGERREALSRKKSEKLPVKRNTAGRRGGCGTEKVVVRYTNSP